MKVVEIEAESRKEIGKNKVKKLRKEDKIPVVIYGEGSIPLTIKASDALKLFTLRHDKFFIKLKIDRKDEKDALLKDIQLDPVKNIVSHLDFLELIKGKTITTKIPLVLKGDPEGVKMGGIIEHFLWEVTIECLPKDIPESFELDISELNIGDALHVSDLKAVEGVKMIDKEEQVIMMIGLPTGVGEEVEEEEAIEGEEGEAVEGEEAVEGAEGEAKEGKEAAAEGEEVKEKGKKMTPEEMAEARRAKRKEGFADKKKK